MPGIITDPIGDMLARIKNANQRKHKTVSLPHSVVKKQILDILTKEGFIGGYTEKGEGIAKELEIKLKYVSDQRVINGVKRISKPGLRVYASTTKLPRVQSGFGTAIISTSQGMMTDKEARKLNIGGEIVAYV